MISGEIPVGINLPHLYHRYLTQLVYESNLRIMPKQQRKKRKSHNDSQQARKKAKEHDTHCDQAEIENVPPPNPNVPASSKEATKESSPIPNSSSSTGLDEAKISSESIASSYSSEKNQDELLTELRVQKTEVTNAIVQQLATLQAVEQEVDRIDDRRTEETVRYNNLIRNKEKLNSRIRSVLQQRLQANYPRFGRE